MAMKSLRSNEEKTTSERIRNKLYKEVWSPKYVNLSRKEFDHIETVNTRLLRTVLEFRYKRKRLMGKFGIRWFVQALKETRKSENFWQIKRDILSRDKSNCRCFVTWHKEIAEEVEDVYKYWHQAMLNLRANVTQMRSEDSSMNHRG